MGYMMLKDKLLKWTGIFAVLLVFLMPLKFGGLAAIPETTSLYMSEPYAWFLISWPTLAFTLFSGALLLLTGLLLPFPPGTFSASLRVALLTVLLLLVSFIGIIGSSCHIYAYLQILHILGIAAFACALFRLLQNSSELKNYLLGAVIAGALLSIFEGFYQLRYGFEETKNFIYEQEVRTGVKYATGNLATRISETRVFAFFSLCNSFAAHLVLTIPIVLWGCVRIARRGKQPVVAGLIISVPVMALMLLMLFYTGSRAAVLALMLTGGICVVTFPFDKRLRILAGIAGLAALCAAVLYVKYSSRGFLSMTVRFDYFRAAWEMFLHNPLTGVGWGDFFHEYMKIKTVISDEAPHDPHNFVLTFASQTGIAGLLVSAAFLVYPAWALLNKVRKGWTGFSSVFSLESMAFVGWTAWTLHTLSDINFEIPGTVATALVIVFAALYSSGTTDTARRKSLKFMWILLWGGIALSSIIFSLYAIKGEIAFFELQELCDYRTRTPEEFAKISTDEVNLALYRAADLQLSSPFPWAAAADFMWIRRRPELAIMYYKEAQKRSPCRPSFYYRLYMFNLMLGNKDEALKNLEKARELFPNNPQYKDGAPAP